MSGGVLYLIDCGRYGAKKNYDPTCTLPELGNCFIAVISANLLLLPFPSLLQPSVTPQDGGVNPHVGIGVISRINTFKISFWIHESVIVS